MAQVLLEDVNPYGNIQAVVEVDERVCFFYLFGAEDTDFEMKAVWVRNLAAAPEHEDMEAMKSGLAPRNPRPHCAHVDPQPAPNADSLRVVWLPEGNGAALYEADQIIAIIPPWSGVNGFSGYARDAVGEGNWAWQLDDDNVLHERFAAAHSYWECWRGDENPWTHLQASQLKSLESLWGEASNYYAIDGGEWPPRAMVRFRLEKCQLLVTVGMALLPQPGVELVTDDPSPLRRVELGVVMPPEATEDEVTRLGQYLSGQSRLPWTRYTWLGAGHTIPCDSWGDERFSAALLVADPPEISLPDYGEVEADPVNLLWFLPITGDERIVAIESGSDELLAQLPDSRWTDSR